MYLYLAARYSRRLELCGYRTILENLGHHVTSCWLHGAHEVADATLTTIPREQVARFAQEDYTDICVAQALIAFTEKPYTIPTRGGRFVELGMALALRKKVYVVGPRENVFCALPQITLCATFDECLATLKEP